MEKENVICRLWNSVYYRFIERPFHRQHIELLEREIIGCCRSVLDVGCGNGNHMRSVTPHLTYSVGIDMFQESLDDAKNAGIYSETRRISATTIRNEFKPHSFECVVAFDLIEHLDKPQGFRLLEDMERLASKKVIVFTPNGFLPQGILGGNEHQMHRSGWSVSQMRYYGYRVIGVHGIKPILGEESLPRWKPHKFWYGISVLTQPLCAVWPEWAFQIFCIKDIAAEKERDF
jgi:SAM-dependent methyltransferase